MSWEYQDLEPVDHFTDIRGPNPCPCPDRKHHWYITFFPGCLEPGDDDYEDASRHPAVLEGHKDWLECKHCSAWHPVTSQMLDDPDFYFV